MIARTQPRSLLAFLFCLASLLGCARNAVFELEIELPARADPVMFAVVQARSDLAFTDAGWDVASDESAVSFALQTTCSRSATPAACDERTLDPTCARVVSVVGDVGRETSPLAMRIRFCRDATCSAEPDPPEHRVMVERAFYVGRYTQGRVCVDEVPSAAITEEIERCDVRCREGSVAMHCRLDGTHFCE